MLSHRLGELKGRCVNKITEHHNENQTTPITKPKTKQNELTLLDPFWIYSNV